MRLLIFVILICLPMMANAEKIEINGIWYNLIAKSQTAEVTYGNWDATSYSYNGNDERYSGDVIIPSSFEYEGHFWNVTSIGLNAFRGCSFLTSVSLPNGLTSIGVSAFLGCKSLKTVYIPQSVTLIDYGAFRGCSGLTKVFISDIKAWLNTSFGDEFFSWPHEANPLRNAKHLYLNNVEVKDLVIPDGVTSIGNFAFDGCEGLSSVTIPNSVTSIGYSAFDGCSGITNINIPNSITSINHYAFNNCTGLNTVLIPNSVVNIGQYAFYGCSNITSLELSQSINHIDSYTFSGCSRLSSIVIPNGVTSIYGGAFYNCKSLKSLTIGSGIKYFSKSTYDHEAFEQCKELTDVYCLAVNVPNANSDLFKESMIEYATLHVPSISVYKYKETEPWKSFKEIIPIEGESILKCEKPTISYENGKLVFNSATEEVDYISDITDGDVGKKFSQEVNLSVTYNISVYVTKAGYEASDVARASLCWIDKEPATEGITDGVAQIPSKAVLIQSEGGILKVEGIDDGTQVSVYAPDGKQAGSAVSRNGAALVGTSIQPGNTAIVKIGEKTVKIVVM